MGVGQSDGTADVVRWLNRDEALYAAGQLAQQYGRPIVTGIGVAQSDPADEASWFIRVDFHGMVLGDTHLIVRNPLDMRQVAIMYQRISESNKAEIIAERERMNAAYEAAQQAAQQEKKQAVEAGAYLGDWCADPDLEHDLCTDGACECPCHREEGDVE